MAILRLQGAKSQEHRLARPDEAEKNKPIFETGVVRLLERLAVFRVGAAIDRLTLLPHVDAHLKLLVEHLRDALLVTQSSGWFVRIWLIAWAHDCSGGFQLILQQGYLVLIAIAILLMNVVNTNGE